MSSSPSSSTSSTSSTSSISSSFLHSYPMDYTYPLDRSAGVPTSSGSSRSSSSGSRYGDYTPMLPFEYGLNSSSFSGRHYSTYRSSVEQRNTFGEELEAKIIAEQLQRTAHVASLFAFTVFIPIIALTLGGTLAAARALNNSNSGSSSSSSLISGTGDSRVSRVATPVLKEEGLSVTSRSGVERDEKERFGDAPVPPKPAKFLVSRDSDKGFILESSIVGSTLQRLCLIIDTRSRPHPFKLLVKFSAEVPKEFYDYFKMKFGSVAIFVPASELNSSAMHTTDRKQMLALLRIVSTHNEIPREILERMLAIIGKPLEIAPQDFGQQLFGVFFEKPEILQAELQNFKDVEMEAARGVYWPCAKVDGDESQKAAAEQSLQPPTSSPSVDKTDET